MPVEPGSRLRAANPSAVILGTRLGFAAVARAAPIRAQTVPRFASAANSRGISKETGLGLAEGRRSTAGLWQEAAWSPGSPLLKCRSVRVDRFNQGRKRSPSRL